MGRVHRVKRYFLSKASVNIVMNIRLFLGLYYNYDSYNYVKLIFRIYCATVALLSIISMHTVLDREVLYTPASYYFTEFFFNSLLSFVSGGNYYLKFFSALATIDDSFKYRSNFVSYRTYIIGGGAVFLRVSAVACNYWISVLSLPQAFLFGFLAVCQGMSYLPIYMILDAIKSRMLTWTKELTSIEETAASRQEDNITKKKLRIKSFVRNYDQLMNNLEDNNWMLHTVLFSLKLINFPKLILYFYLGSMFFVTGRFEKIFPTVCGFLNTVACVSVPGIFVEMIVREITRMEEYFMKQLVTCRDEQLKKEIRSALKYIELRPFKLDLFRIFRVHGTLPITYISLCITYTVVFAQCINFKV